RRHRPRAGGPARRRHRVADPEGGAARRLPGLRAAAARAAGVGVTDAEHLRSPEEYRESLRDGRRVFYRGERVEDVTTHPVFRHAVEHASLDYVMAEDPAQRALAATEDG